MAHNTTVIILISLIVIIGQISVSRACGECNKTYIAPSNMKYPFGDENQMNSDVTMNDTNKIICQDKKNYQPEYGRCPFPPEDPNDIKLTNPYVHCPVFPPLPGVGQIPVGAPLSSAVVQCKSCDLKLTPDGAAVNMKCIGCHDLPSNEREANLTEKDIVYTVYYVEIANYTSVEVEGRENFNP